MSFSVDIITICLKQWYMEILFMMLHSPEKFNYSRCCLPRLSIAMQISFDVGGITDNSLSIEFFDNK